jgi:hypothetical protein
MLNQITSKWIIVEGRIDGEVATTTSKFFHFLMNCYSAVTRCHELILAGECLFLSASAWKKNLSRMVKVGVPLYLVTCEDQVVPRLSLISLAAHATRAEVNCKSRLPVSRRGTHIALMRQPVPQKRPASALEPSPSEAKTLLRKSFKQDHTNTRRKIRAPIVSTAKTVPELSV